MQIIVLAVPTKNGDHHGISRHLQGAADGLELLAADALDTAIKQRTAVASRTTAAREGDRPATLLWWRCRMSHLELLALAENTVESPVSPLELSPRAIREAVLEEERPGFERQFREAMAVAAETLDLSEVEELLRAWQRIAELTDRDGRENRQRILAKAVRVWRNRHVPNPDAARGSREFDELLRERLTEQQRQQLNANRERMRR